MQKIRAHQNKIRNILKNQKEIIEQKEVNYKLLVFYNNSLKSDKRRPKHHTAQVLSLIQITHFTEDQSAKYEISILEDEVICALKNMQKNHLVTMV